MPIITRAIAEIEFEATIKARVIAGMDGSAVDLAGVEITEVEIDGWKSGDGSRDKDVAYAVWQAIAAEALIGVTDDDWRIETWEEEIEG